jgi:CRP-like cAMP-binding protein
MDTAANRLLASLPPADGAYLASLSRIEHPPQGRVLTRGSDPGAGVWFPHGGAVALIATDASGRSVQTGIVGCEGCIGLEALFGYRRSAPDAVVQIEGPMSVLSQAHLQAALEARPRVQAALSVFLYGLSMQSLQTVACNRLHNLLPRCCRWLLTMQDKAKSNDIPLTQEGLATLLGGGRPRVNRLLAALETDGVLRRYRGRIHLLRRADLERHSCECYRLTRSAGEQGKTG